MTVFGIQPLHQPGLPTTENTVMIRIMVLRVLAVNISFLPSPFSDDLMNSLLYRVSGISYISLLFVDLFFVRTQAVVFY